MIVPLAGAAANVTTSAASPSDRGCGTLRASLANGTATVRPVG